MLDWTVIVPGTLSLVALVAAVVLRFRKPKG